MSRRARDAALIAAAALAPLGLLVVGRWVSLPSGMSYLVHEGRAWIILVAVLAVAGFLTTSPLTSASDHRLGAATILAPRGRSGSSDGRLALLLAGTGWLLAAALMPGFRWDGEAFGGDEPKYLRLADSLLHDMDVDVASRSLAAWSPSGFGAQLQRLLRDTGDALRELSRPAVVPDGHRWSRGNWTLNGLHGGQYYVQSPGLPLLLLPARIAQQSLAPDRAPSHFPLLALALLWGVALAQTSLLASEVSGSRTAGVIAGLAVTLSAPLLIGGFHFYPESAAAAFVPWLVRYARAAGPQPGRSAVVALGLGCAALPWLHPKFLLLSLVLGALLGWKLRGRRRALAAGSLAFAVPLFGLLLFDHHVTGLFTPDALYRRYGSTLYSGPAAFLRPLVVNGLVTGLFGARDGLFVMAPVLIAGVLGAGVAWRRDARAVSELALVFGSLWLAAAVHEGGAPGPPGRLLAPVAAVPAALLAVGLVELRRSAPYLLTAVTLAAVSAAISGGMLADWRRTVNPYRTAFAGPASDFAKDLPDGPGRASGGSTDADKSRDRLRGLLLTALLAFWAWAFARPARQAPSAAGPIAAWCASFWGTLALAALGLSALGP